MILIDLSKPIQYNKYYSWFMKVKITHKAHKKVKWLLRFLGLPFNLFPKNFAGWADGSMQKMGVHELHILMLHVIIHLQSNGKKSKTIDEMPLDLCYGQGLVIDMKYKEDFDAITIANIELFLKDNNLTTN